MHDMCVRLLTSQIIHQQLSVPDQYQDGYALIAATHLQRLLVAPSKFHTATVSC